MKFIEKSGLFLTLSLFTILFYSCSDLKSNINNTIFPISEKFGDYWYQGKAELNRYELEQIRYGETRHGDAVLVYVTEDFLKNEQVKYEYSGGSSEKQSVLKLNFNRRFYTGVYPYSLLTSIFSPIKSDDKHVLKITSTAQEWCGHTFMQLNNRNNKFSVQLNSYFELEGDKQYEMDQSLLEDEVWTLIRINPELLPVGEVEIIPGMQYVRLFHKEFKNEPAIVKKNEIVDTDLSPNSLIQYAIHYQNLPRSLIITFEKAFPHQIISWEEMYQSTDEGRKGGLLITKAKRTKRLMLDYWHKNSVADSTYRHELGMKN
jgi:hypothetical protein